MAKREKARGMTGAEEMSGNEAHRTYSDAATAQLGERVTNLGRRQSDLESEMRSGFKNVETTMSAIAHEMRSSISTLSASIAERSRTQWPVIWAAAGVCFTVLATGGAFFYNSLSKGQDRLDDAITTVVERMVTQKELEWRTARGAEDRSRMESSVKEVRDAQVPRAELERVWQSQDQTTAQLQKQIDELKANSASVYTPRDVLLDNRERIDRLERQRLTPGG